MASHIGAPSNRRNYHKAKGAGIRTTPDTFGVDMENLFKTYTDNVVAAIIDETKDTADKGCQMLRETTQPAMSRGGTAKPMKRRIWNKYRRSWYVQVREGLNFYHTTIRSRKPLYRLTHLLEYGHVTRDGNRTRAFEHIKPVDELCQARLLKNIPKIIERGG